MTSGGWGRLEEREETFAQPPIPWSAELDAADSPEGAGRPRLARVLILAILGFGTLVLAWLR